MRFKTDFKPTKILLGVKIIKAPFTLEVAVYDHKRPNTAFYLRKEDFSKSESTFYDINLPMVNDEISLALISKDENLNLNDYLKITRLQITDYDFKRPNFDEKTKSFVKLVEDFSAQAGYLPANYKFKSNDGQFEIRYLPHIPTDNGGIHVTPARIHTTQNFIEVSKLHFEKKPVPRRIAILLHEMSHNFVNVDQNDEEEADLNAARIYLSLGYPKSEFLYAFSKTFKTYTDKEFEKLVSNPSWYSNYNVNVNRLGKTYEYLKNN
jgi:hypothetical protein